MGRREDNIKMYVRKISFKADWIEQAPKIVQIRTLISEEITLLHIVCLLLFIGLFSNTMAAV
jgi:hypothetical protein